jgi:propionyl-CoA synthetase
MRYQGVHELSVSNPRFFWRQKMNLIKWFEEPREILTRDSNGLYRWFQGGVLNTCYLALDYHVDHGARTADRALLRLGLGPPQAQLYL